MSSSVLHLSKQVLLPRLSSSRQRCHVSNGGGSGVGGALVCRFPRKWDRPSLLFQMSRSCESTVSTSKFIRRRRTSKARLFSFSGDEEFSENVNDDDPTDSDAAESFSDKKIVAENFDDDRDRNATESFSDKKLVGEIIVDDHGSNATESFSGEESTENMNDDLNSNSTGSFPGEESAENINDDDHDSNATESFSGEESAENINSDPNSNATGSFPGEESAENTSDDDRHSNATESFSCEESPENINDDPNSDSKESFPGEESAEKEGDDGGFDQLKLNPYPESYKAYSFLGYRYLFEVTKESHNRMLRANFAELLYQFLGDYVRAEYHFEKAIETKEDKDKDKNSIIDAEVYRKYAEFLWKVKNDLVAANSAFLQACSLEPKDISLAAYYAHFLRITRFSDTDDASQSFSGEQSDDGDDLDSDVTESFSGEESDEKEGDDDGRVEE